MTDNFRESSSRRSIALEEPHIEALRESLDRLRLEVDGAARVPRAARPGRRCRPPQNRARPPRRRAAAPGRARGQPAARAPAGRTPIRPRRRRSSTRWGATCSRRWTRRRSSRSGSTRRCSRRAASPRRCARRRRAPASRPASRSTADARYPPEVAGDGLLLLSRGARARRRRGARDGHRAGRGGSARLRDRRRTAALEAGLDRLRDRVEALGGRLTIQSEPGRGTRVSGSLPLSR